MNLSIIVGLVLVALIVVLLFTNKKLVETLKNIYKIEELRNRILFTLGLLLVYRLGSFVTLPGVDHVVLEEATRNFANDNSLLGLLNIFSGGAFAQASIFALGVMPYITASIIIQLLGIMVPYFRKMQREGESGRRKMNQWTRFLTIAVLILQGPAYLYSQVLSWGAVSPACSGDLLGLANGQFVIPSVIILIAGTMFIMWLGEKITDKGIGNGISLIIMIGIVARLPQSFLQEFSMQVLGEGSIIMFIVELIFLALVFMLAIAIVQAVRRIPVQYAKRIVGNKQYGGVRQYIPLKLNAANVMPIIFAQALMFIPGLIWKNNAAWTDITSFWYNFTLVVLVVAFTYFYTAIIVNPQMMADDMKRNGGFIPGVKPGKSTVKYIDDIMTRITLPGSIFLALITVLPAIAMTLGISQGFAYFFGGTSLLIMVGVVLDTLKQIESYLLMRHYDGLMKTGRIQGRY
jgi:preprotein translocase subunit SecY